MTNYPSVPKGMKSVKLNTGKEMPIVGLGTWQSKPGEVADAVETALKAGYRHIDCAWMYGNEHEVGQGIKASGVPREDIFITTKIWSTYHTRVEEGLNDSLQKLGVEYVDLLLLHWPVALIIRGDEKIPLNDDGSRALDKQRTLGATWSDMEKVFHSGKAKAIGVSNCSEPFLEDLLKTATVVPAANQIELHPYLPQHGLVRYCSSKGIACEAYSPLGSTGSPLLQEPLIQQISKKRNCDPAQIVISWQTQRGIAVLPKSVTPSRIISNGLRVDLEEDEMMQINELHKQDGKHIRFLQPKWGVDFKFADPPSTSS